MARLLASNGDESMKALKNEQHKLKNSEMKLLVKRKRERGTMRLDEKLSSNFRDNSKLFWKEVRNSRSCSTSIRMNAVHAKDGSLLINLATFCSIGVNFMVRCMQIMSPNTTLRRQSQKVKRSSV